MYRFPASTCSKISKRSKFPARLETRAGSKYALYAESSASRERKPRLNCAFSPSAFSSYASLDSHATPGRRSPGNLSRLVRINGDARRASFISTSRRDRAEDTRRARQRWSWSHRWTVVLLQVRARTKTTRQEMEGRLPFWPNRDTAPHLNLTVSVLPVFHSPFAPPSFSLFSRRYPMSKLNWPEDRWSSDLASWFSVNTRKKWRSDQWSSRDDVPGWYFSQKKVHLERTSARGVRWEFIRGGCCVPQTIRNIARSRKPVACVNLPIHRELCRFVGRLLYIYIVHVSSEGADSLTIGKFETSTSTIEHTRSLFLNI